MRSFFHEEGQNKLPNIRRFKIVGILIRFQEFDATYVLGDIRHMQRIKKESRSSRGI
jgi:lipoprotein-releasing system permease protein